MLTTSLKSDNVVFCYTMNELIALAMMGVGVGAAIYIYFSGKNVDAKLHQNGPQIHATSNTTQSPVKVDPPVETMSKTTEAVQEIVQAPQKPPETVEPAQLEASKTEVGTVQAQTSETIKSEPPKMQTEDVKVEAKRSRSKRTSTRRRTKTTK
jgi:hypothetical protein